MGREKSLARWSGGEAGGGPFANGGQAVDSSSHSARFSAFAVTRSEDRVTLGVTGAADFGPGALLAALLVRVFLQQLKVFLPGIALFAGLALAMGLDATPVLALLALGSGPFTASQPFRGLLRSRSRSHQQGGQASQNDQHLNQLHNLQRYTFVPTD